MKLLLAALSPLCLSALIITTDIVPSGKPKVFQSIKILDQKEIIIKKISGVSFREASDLAYDAKRQKLYMVGDKGSLFAFDAIFGEKIEKLIPLSGVPVTKEGGKPFKKWKRDTEGLAFDDKGRLLISFEGKPKIGAFGIDGQRLKNYKLPKSIRDTKRYKNANKSLESVAFHPKHGILTAAERPLKKRKHQTIYALDGKEWHFKAEKDKKSSVTALEVMDDGNILVLERAYTHPLKPLVITLKKVYLDRISNGLCHTEIIAKMSNEHGWMLDNFEGLTKVSPNRYLMISDDNDNLFQRTLLIYFEVIE